MLKSIWVLRNVLAPEGSVAINASCQRQVSARASRNLFRVAQIRYPEPKKSEGIFDVLFAHIQEKVALTEPEVEENFLSLTNRAKTRGRPNSLHR